MKIFLRILLVVILFYSNSEAQTNTEISFGTTEIDAGFSIRQTIEGNYIIAGSTESPVNVDEEIYLALLDSNGAVIWTKIIGGADDEYATCVRQTPDSGFILTGVTNSFGRGFADMYLVRTDKNGDTLWTKTFGGGDYDLGYSVENTFDGGFIVSGQESSTNGGIANIFLVKTTAAGDSVWGRSYPMAAWTAATNVLQTPDSGFVIFGDYENNITGLGDYDLYWMKLDALGNIVSTKTYEDTISHDYAESMRNTFDGGFIIASEKEPILTLDAVGSTIIRLDANLDTMWTKKCIYDFTYSIRDIVQTCDSGFIATGYVLDSLFSNTMFITKFNGNGDSIWNKYYSGLSSAGGYSIDNSRDDSIVICGATIDSGGTQTDVYFVKSENGGCGGIQCNPVITMQPADSAVFENMQATFTIQAAIQSTSFQWQVDSTGSFLDLSDLGNFSGTTTNMLVVSNAQLGMDGYHYRCIVQSPTNCSDTSNSATMNVSIDPTLGIERVSERFISVYPNPSNGIFNFNYLNSNDRIKEIEILNLLGEQVYQSTKSTINLSGYTNGIYFYKLKTLNGKILSGKLLKQ
ncbi:MAG: T9SS type A sorting domain-containing protein [bacterium]